MGGPFSSARLRAAVREIARRAALRDAIAGAFETMPGDRRFCVRRLEVVEHVAKALEIRVVNNRMFERVTREAEAMGWEAFKSGNRSLFRCAKRRGQNAEEALAVSRANRFDPRTARPVDGGALNVTG